MSEDLPWACAMAECSPPLVVEIGRNVTKSRTGLDCRNLGGRINRNLEHPIQLHHKMPILTTKAKGCVAVPARLWAHFYPQLGGAGNGALDMLDSRGHCDCHRRIF